jgi:NRPS condensation-like uncharacterized protein
LPGVNQHPQTLQTESNDSTVLPPLKLTPFEEYMFFDDCPDYPMTGVFRLRFSGKLNFDAMQAAVEQTVERHPLVRAIVRVDAKLGYVWDVADSSTIKLERWTADANNEYPIASFIDLTKTVGTRVWLVENSEAHDLVAQIHHACTDALGMCLFVEDLLMLYAKNVGAIENHVQLRPLDNQRMPLRNNFGLTWKKTLRLIPLQILGLHVVGKFFLRNAVPLGTPAQEEVHANLQVVFPSPMSLDLDADTTSKVIAAAKSKNVTVNDLLARDLFLAINAWRSQHETPLKKGWVRFFVPINHRVPQDATLSAANIMSAVFLERHPGQLTDPESLLRSLQAQMQKVKRNQLGFLFIAAHALFSRIPRLRHHVIHQRQCISSCVFSNIGVVFKHSSLPQRDGKLLIGDMTLDKIDFVAPLRPLTAAAFCVSTYARRLSINLHFDPRVISRQQAEELLQMLNCRIHESLTRQKTNATPCGKE